MPILFLVVFVNLVGFGIIVPLLPFYAEHFHASPFLVGLVMASYSLAQFVAAPFWGRLSDKWGRKPVILLGLLGSAAAYVGLAFVDSLWMLFAVRGAGGLLDGTLAGAYAYTADVTSRDGRARGMGVIGAAFGLGFIIGPGIGGLLAGSDPEHADFRSPSLASAGLAALACVLAFFLLKESLRRTAAASASVGLVARLAALAASMRRPNFGILLGLSFVAAFVFSGLESTFAMWSRRQFGWGPEQNGYVFAFVGVLGAIVQGGLIGRLAAWFGETNLVVQGAAALAIGLALIPFAEGLPVLLLALAVAGYGFSVIMPSLASLISLQAPAGEQGTMMGISRSSITLGRVLGPAWGGLLFSALGKDWPFLFGAAVMIGVCLLAARRRNADAMSAAPAAGKDGP